MIPYKDDNPTGTFPYVTIAVIALNVVVYLVEIFNPAGPQRMVLALGAVPAKLFSFSSYPPGDPLYQPIPAQLSVFTSMFMHGGLFHLGGNMLYLWIFGNNIEDRLGHFRFVVFYLLCGIAAAYAHALSSPGSVVPMIGASGAVSGVLAAYLLLYPRAMVHTLIFLGFFVQVVRVPALIVIGFWAIIQLINGVLSKGLADQGGVAWFAHLGGFFFGMIALKILLPGRRRKSW